MADPYQVLGVGRDATADAIRKAYRRLAKQHHPDLNPGDQAAEAKFKEIQGAYDIRDICLSVPSVVGRKGVEKHVEIKLWPKEQMALQASARALKETLAKVKA